MLKNDLVDMTKKIWLASLVQPTTRLFAEGTKQFGCHNQTVWW
jgi:hypothetical protein